MLMKRAVLARASVSLSSCRLPCLAAKSACRAVWTPTLPPGMAAPPSGPVDAAADRAAALAFIEERGYPPATAAAVLTELSKPDWGASAGGLLPLAKRLAGAYEVGDDAGLRALAVAVEKEFAAAAGKVR